VGVLGTEWYVKSISLCMHMLPRLPGDVWTLIRTHPAALALQRAWRRYTLWAHARRPLWPVVRAHLRHVRAWPQLLAYAQVRREMRSECASWLCTDERGARRIAAEAREGAWGARSPRWPA